MVAEAPLTLALVWLWVFRVLNSGAVDSDVFLALNLQSRVVASDIYGVATSPCRFAAN